MNKKIITILLASAVAASMLNVFAYDESAASKYVLDTISNLEITTKQEYDDNADIIRQGLTETYGLTEQEANDLIADFAKTFEETTDNNKNTDNIGGEDAADETKQQKEKADIDYKKDMLSQLKLIPSEYDYAVNVTRGNFALYMANLISYGKDYSGENGYFDFNDVKDDSEFYPAVSMLINKGAVIGVGEGLYAPAEAITVNQACAIAVRLMGYDIEKMPKDENDTFYYSKASEINLIKGIKAKNTEPLSGTDAITFLYNILDTNVYEMVVTGDEAFYYKDGTFLSKYMNVEWIEDVVTANSKTGLYSASQATAEGHLCIGDYVFDFGETDIDLDSFLGKRVRVYYNEDERSEAVAITTCSGYNDSTTIMAKDIEKYDESTDRLYYDLGEKSEYFEVKKDASVIFNGYAVDYSYDKTVMFTPDVGEVTFLSNDKNKGAEVIIINSYVYYTSGVINAETPVLNDESKLQAEEINLDSFDVTVYSNGEEIEPEKIPKDAIVMVAPQRMKTLEKNGIKYFAPDLENSEHMTMEICTSIKNGSVSKNDTSNKVVTIEKENIAMSSIVVKNAEIFPEIQAATLPPIGASVTVYLDKYGEAALFKITSYASNLRYGYVKRIYEDEENSRFRAKIFTEDGEHIDVFLTPKVKVHKKWDESATLTKSSYYVKSVKDSFVFTLDGDKFKPQMIKFKVNNQGEMNEMFIADTTNKTNSIGVKFDYYVDDSVFMCSYTNRGETIHPEYQINSWYTSDSNTVLFKVPETVAGSIDSDYSVKRTSSGVLGVKNSEYYGVSENGVIGCAVQYTVIKATGEWGWWTSNAVIVTEDPTPVWDEENEQITYQIETYGDWYKRIGGPAEHRTRVFEDPSTISLTYNATEGSGNGRFTLADYSNIPITDIKKGDILFVTPKDDGNNQNVITAFAVIYKNLREYIQNKDLEIGAWHIGPGLGSVMSRYRSASLWSDYNQDMPGGLMCGTCVKVSGNYGYFDAGEGIIRRFSFTKNIRGGDDVVAVYDAKKDKITAGTLADIRVGDYCINYSSRFTVVVKNRY